MVGGNAGTVLQHLKLRVAQICMAADIIMFELSKIGCAPRAPTACAAICPAAVAA
jgi:hypothetical protein